MKRNKFNDIGSGFASFFKFSVIDDVRRPASVVGQQFDLNNISPKPLEGMAPFLF